MGIIEQGCMGFHHENGTYLVPPGSISLVNPGTMHTGYPQAEQGWTYRNFFIDPSIFQEIMTLTTGTEIVPHFPYPVITDTQISKLLIKAHISLESSPIRLERETLLYEALSLLIRKYATAKVLGQEPTICHPGIRRACNLIEDTYQKDLSLDDLAEAANLSRYHFLRTFRKQTGLSPHTYLLQVRANRAKQHLSGGATISETALNCGFCDQSHLTRRFKKIYGITPGRFLAGL